MKTVAKSELYSVYFLNLPFLSAKTSIVQFFSIFKCMHSFFRAHFPLIFTIKRKYPWTSVYIIADCLHQILEMHFFSTAISCNTTFKPSFYSSISSCYCKPCFPYYCMASRFLFCEWFISYCLFNHVIL